MTVATSPLPVVILISGRGSNLQAIIDAVAEKRLSIEICAVISNRPAAEGLQRAREAGIPVAVIDHAQFPDRAAFDQAERIQQTKRSKSECLVGGDSVSPCVGVYVYDALCWRLFVVVVCCRWSVTRLQST